MSLVGMTGMGMGYGASSGLRFSSTRGRMQGGGGQGMAYPNPFFDVAHTYLPVTVKHLFRWVRYFFMTQPLVNATVFKLSEYPITDIVIDHANSEVVHQWMDYMQDHLRYRSFQVEVGLDYHVYGNAFVSIGYPFVKYLTCTNCSFSSPARKVRSNWVFTNSEFRLTCPRCGHTASASVRDYYFRNPSGIKLIRWNPEDIEITYNDITGDYTYFYTIPANVRSDITLGRKDILETTPQVFIEAIKQAKGIVFSKDNFFHLRRPSLATLDRGWGLPLLLPVLKDIFYLQIMKKAQESILLEHIIPLRIIFPQAGSGTSDPYCISPETLVETAEGLLPACEVHSGMYLRSHTGAWRVVEEVARRQVRQDEKVYTVRVDSLPAFPFDVSEDHPLLAVRRTSQRKGRDRQLWVDPSFIPVKDLKPGDYVAYPTERTKSNQAFIDLADYSERAATDRFVYRRLSQGAAEIYEWLEDHGDYSFSWGEREVFLADHGWCERDFATAKAMRAEGSVDRMERLVPVGSSLGLLVGYFLAEGSMNGSLPSFSLGDDEHWIADDIEAAAAELGFRPTSRYERKEQHGLQVDCQDVLLGELLRGLCGEGFAGKRVPQVMSEAPDSVVLRMLHALFAGDGCDFSTDTDRVALKMANPSVVLEARRLLLSFGLVGGITKEVPKEGAISKAPSYNLAYNGEQAQALRLLFSAGVLPSTPWSKLGVMRGGYVLHRIATIEETADVPEVIGFQMADDKSFCVAGVATHNTTINLNEWREHVAGEIARWRYDPNYIPIMPLPIGNQTIGGDGKGLLMAGEIQQWSEWIITGMGVPREFLQGGLSYAGTNVSMRMLENAFLGYIIRHKAMAKWVMQSIASFMKWPEVNIRFKPFKMADDLQRKAYRFQLNQAQKLSDTTLLADDDLDQEEENKIMERETATRLSATKAQQLAMAKIQGEQQLIMMKYQAKAQEAQMAAQGAPAAQGEPGGPETMDEGAPGGQMAGSPDGQATADQTQDPAAMAQGGAPQGTSSPLNQGQQLPAGTQSTVDIPAMAYQYAQQIAQMPPDQQQMTIQTMQQSQPELVDLVIQMLGQMGINIQSPQAMQGVPGAAGAAATEINMNPLPDVLPPRRAAGVV